MAIKSRNLYLYLALACFIGIIAIFIADGYLGIYDTVYITSGEHEQKIEPDYWQCPWAKEHGYDYYGVGSEWGEPVYFRYEIDNRTFSTYSTNVEASVWKSGQKIIDLLDEDVSVASFEQVTVNWTLQTDELGLGSFEAGKKHSVSVKVKHGDVERKIVVDFPRFVEPAPPR